jgi:SPP1 gp7 family putative phage head morphogenesis protein
MLNLAQFAAAKSEAEAAMMQSMVFDENGEVKSFYRFSKDASEVIDTSQDIWLRTEYETCRRQVVALDKFSRMQKDADLYPYWAWRGRMDFKERPEHVDMEGRVFQIGDPESDSCYPPVDWNCRCIGDPVDGMYLDDNSVSPQTNAQAKGILEDTVDEQFRYNPAVQGPMPNKHSYFQVMKNANSGDSQLFNIPKPEGGPLLTGLQAKTMFYLLNIVHEWKQEKHVNNKGEIIFQNKPTRTNVRFSDRSIHTIAKHSKGFENIPLAIEAPDEIWARWEDPGDQKTVERAYIKFGETSYIAMTRAGEMVDAFACANRSLDKYRKGVIL